MHVHMHVHMRMHMHTPVYHMLVAVGQGMNVHVHMYMFMYTACTCTCTCACTCTRPCTTCSWWRGKVLHNVWYMCTWPCTRHAHKVLHNVWYMCTWPCTRHAHKVLHNVWYMCTWPCTHHAHKVLHNVWYTLLGALQWTGWEVHPHRPSHSPRAYVTNSRPVAKGSRLIWAGASVKVVFCRAYATGKLPYLDDAAAFSTAAGFVNFAASMFWVSSE